MVLERIRPHNSRSFTLPLDERGTCTVNGWARKRYPDPSRSTSRKQVRIGADALAVEPVEDLQSARVFRVGFFEDRGNIPHLG